MDERAIINGVGPFRIKLSGFGEQRKGKGIIVPASCLTAPTVQRLCFCRNGLLFSNFVFIFSWCGILEIVESQRTSIGAAEHNVGVFLPMPSSTAKPR